MIFKNFKKGLKNQTANLLFEASPRDSEGVLYARKTKAQPLFSLF